MEFTEEMACCSQQGTQNCLGTQHDRHATSQRKEGTPIVRLPIQPIYGLVVSTLHSASLAKAHLHTRYTAVIGLDGFHPANYV